MKNIIKNTPLPISGLALSFAALGNLFMPYSTMLRNSLGCIATLLLLLIIIKLTFYPKSLIKAFRTPPVAGVLATLPMTITILSTYIKQLNPTLGIACWWLGVLAHFAFIIYFSKNYIIHFKITQVFPAWFVMFIGIVTASVAAPTHGLNTHGQFIFWIGSIFYVALLPVILYRVIIIKQIPLPARPTIAIFAAPASLLLAGYQASFENLNILLLTILAGFSIAMYLTVLFYLPYLFKAPFSASYSAFTFPLVISAIALKPIVNKMGFEFLNSVTSAIACLAVIIVSINYTRLWHNK